MARLTQICLATLALLVVVTRAAPCHDNHGDIIEHDHDHELDFDDFEDGDDYDDGEDFNDGGNWDNEDPDNGEDGCVDFSPCDGGDEWDHDGSDNWDDGSNGGGHNGGHNGGGHNGGPVRGSVGGGSDDGDSLIGVNAGFIGVNDVNGQEALNDAVDLRRLGINDLVQNVDAL